jgi:hypothetical protein
MISPGRGEFNGEIADARRLEAGEGRRDLRSLAMMTVKARGKGTGVREAGDKRRMSAQARQTGGIRSRPTTHMGRPRGRPLLFR